MYDLIIIGSGIAGLHVGLETLRHSNKKQNILILEKYNYVGGRVVTHYKGGKQYEIGAGRIFYKHHLVRGLMKRYGLTWLPMGGESQWKTLTETHEDIFTDLSKVYLRPLYLLSKEYLAKSTLYELLVKIHGKQETERFIEQFPYWSEVHLLRADLALKSFEEEMGGWSDFGGCKEGLSAIVKSMADEFKSLGGSILLNTEVIDVIHKNNKEHIVCKDGSVLVTNACVLALHRDAIAELPSLKKLPILSKVEMDQLLRIYAIFPVKHGKSWFTDVQKTITNLPIRFIIPVNATKGILMISYTDGENANEWIRRIDKKEDVQTDIMRQIRSLFPDHSIPDPLEFRTYPWYNGCSFWLPGNYNPEKESHDILCIRDTLFCCGESFSMRQAWMEGALEHAEELLEHKKFRALCIEK